MFCPNSTIGLGHSLLRQHCWRSFMFLASPWIINSELELLESTTRQSLKVYAPRELEPPSNHARGPCPSPARDAHKPETHKWWIWWQSHGHCYHSGLSAQGWHWATHNPSHLLLWFKPQKNALPHLWPCVHERKDDCVQMKNWGLWHYWYQKGTLLQHMRRHLSWRSN